MSHHIVMTALRQPLFAANSHICGFLFWHAPRLWKFLS
jgi:hypothetical protein